ncbi:MAG: hypothetical protein IKY36_05930 [Bacteroidales bacterium]|nr:hypothetical protein [Bacteroidales bacterium]
MRKILLLMAVLLPLSLFGKNDDNENAVVKIPLQYGQGVKNNRNIFVEPIESYYYYVTNTIITNVLDGSGSISVSVFNRSTGEVWYDTIDCSVQQQIITQISGTPGVYEVVYMTASGDTYSGLFEIK